MGCDLPRFGLRKRRGSIVVPRGASMRFLRFITAKNI